MLVLVSGNHHLLRAILYTWSVRFKAVEYDKCASVDPVIIMANWGIHCNTCDPSYNNNKRIPPVRTIPCTTDIIFKFH